MWNDCKFALMLLLLNFLNASVKILHFFSSLAEFNSTFSSPGGNANKEIKVFYFLVILLFYRITLKSF